MEKERRRHGGGKPGIHGRVVVEAVLLVAGSVAGGLFGRAFGRRRATHQQKPLLEGLQCKIKTLEGDLAGEMKARAENEKEICNKAEEREAVLQSKVDQVEQERNAAKKKVSIAKEHINSLKKCNKALEASAAEQQAASHAQAAQHASTAAVQEQRIQELTLALAAAKAKLADQAKQMTAKEHEVAAARAREARLRTAVKSVLTVCDAVDGAAQHVNAFAAPAKACTVALSKAESAQHAPEERMENVEEDQGHANTEQSDIKLTSAQPALLKVVMVETRIVITKTESKTSGPDQVDMPARNLASAFDEVATSPAKSVLAVPQLELDSALRAPLEKKLKENKTIMMEKMENQPVMIGTEQIQMCKHHLASSMDTSDQGQAGEQPTGAGAAKGWLQKISLPSESEEEEFRRGDASRHTWTSDGSSQNVSSGSEVEEQPGLSSSPVQIVRRVAKQRVSDDPSAQLRQAISGAAAWRTATWLGIRP